MPLLTLLSPTLPPRAMLPLQVPLILRGNKACATGSVLPDSPAALLLVYGDCELSQGMRGLCCSCCVTAGERE